MKKAILTTVAAATLLSGGYTAHLPKADAGAGVSYSSKNLSAAVTNAASAANVKFKDVPASHWAYAAIMSAVSSGYLKGYADGTFKPAAQITKAEMAAILGRLSDQPVVDPDNKAYFSDIPAWAKEGVEAAVQKGFIDPSKYNGKLRANEPLTRGELAVWLAQGLGAMNPDYKTALSDVTNTVVPAKEYFTGKLPAAQKNSVAVAMGTGLMSVADDKTFGLDRTTTRAEAATLIARYLQVAKKQPSEFQGLEELRAVGLTGTNIKVIAPSYTKMSERGISQSGWDPKRVTDDFSLIRNQDLVTKTGYASVEVNNWIIVNPYVQGSSRSIYYPVFLDEGDKLLHGSYYSFVDVSLSMNKPIGMTAAGNLINSPTFDFSSSPRSKAFQDYAAPTMYTQLKGFPETFSTLTPRYWAEGMLHFDDDLDPVVYIRTKSGLIFYIVNY
ncbi:S-layer homology domain-containing protein [Paenibacillus pinistramenti]|uniref:S-layer homology domain-containing protein n=1 Tax=Paenibacillus pinistramenti TaxID=1768003 RepID=UPI0011084330|nr:S-layer homology domain-containing protein [Paenibacillus pinistramenti]